VDPSERTVRLRRVLAGAPLLLAMLGAISCGDDRSTANARAGEEPAWPPVAFTDITEQAGISFRHESGAFGKKYLPETMGSGCAFLDYDGDAHVDLFLVNSTTWPERRGRRPAYPALYRNRGDGTFDEATGEAGLRVESYGMGVAVGDYDNDGDPDLFLNALGPDRLYRNRGDGTFEDVTNAAGVSDPAFGSSATFLDYDRDGWLDLFVCNYVVWTPEGVLHAGRDEQVLLHARVLPRGPRSR
jgi:hypothetical protein